MLVRLEYNTQEYVLWKLLPLNNNIHHIVAFTVCGTTSTRHSVRIEPQYACFVLAYILIHKYINANHHRLCERHNHDKKPSTIIHMYVLYIYVFVYFQTFFYKFAFFFHRFSCCFSIAYTVSEHILSWFFPIFFSHFIFFLIFSYFSCCWFAASGAIVRCWYIFFLLRIQSLIRFLFRFFDKMVETKACAHAKNDNEIDIT